MNAENLSRGAGAAGAFVAAALIKQRKEASRPRIQRMFGASPRRRAGEQLTIMVGSQIAGGAAAVAATGAVAGTQWYRDRKARLASARIIRQVIGAAAMTPDGVMTEESELIFRGAMAGTGVAGADLRRLEGVPLPASVRDLEPCALREPLLTAVATVAFSAMAAANGETEAARRMPALLLRLGLPRPTAEAAAARFLEDYVSARVVLSDHYRLLRPEASGTRPRLELPLPETLAAAQLAMAIHPGEQARLASRRVLTAVIGQGARAVLDSRIPLAPAVHTAVRLASQLSRQQTPVPSSPPAPVRAPAQRELEQGELEQG